MLDSGGAFVDHQPQVLISFYQNIRSIGRNCMAIVKVQKKGQITLPSRLRSKAGIADGDVLDAKLEHGKITLTRKSALDRQIAESMEDYKKGRFYGPFDTHAEFAASIKSNLKRIAKTRP
jgi:AbrB family looped-hinge helix DNA binding protein